MEPDLGGGDKSSKYESDMTSGEKLDAAKTAQEIGNGFFKQGEYSKAIAEYNRALGFITNDFAFSSSDARRAKQQREPCYTNLAACFLKQKEFYEARRNCDKALELNDTSIKALFRRGVANTKLGEYELAQKDFKKLLVEEPGNKKTIKELDKLELLKSRQKKKQARIYKKMFNQALDGSFSDNRKPLDTFGKLMHYIEKYWDSAFLVCGIGCCFGHITGLLSNTSWISSTLLATSLISSGSIHVNKVVETEALFPSWIPHRNLIARCFGGIELFLGIALFTSSKVRDRTLIARIVATLGLLLTVPAASQLRSYSLQQLFAEIMQMDGKKWRRYLCAIMFGLWGLAISQAKMNQ